MWYSPGPHGSGSQTYAVQKQREEWAVLRFLYGENGLVKHKQTTRLDIELGLTCFIGQGGHALDEVVGGFLGILVFQTKELSGFERSGERLDHIVAHGNQNGVDSEVSIVFDAVIWIEAHAILIYCKLTHEPKSKMTSKAWL